MRDILESSETLDTESLVFRQARDQYMSCMDLDKLEEIGIQPALDLLKLFGGWPVLEDNWNEDNFKWCDDTIFD